MATPAIVDSKPGVGHQRRCRRHEIDQRCVTLGRVR
jgi:hypothetical protein